MPLVRLATLPLTRFDGGQGARPTPLLARAPLVRRGLIRFLLFQASGALRKKASRHTAHTCTAHKQDAHAHSFARRAHVRMDTFAQLRTQADARTQKVQRCEVCAGCKAEQRQEEVQEKDKARGGYLCSRRLCLAALLASRSPGLFAFGRGLQASGPDEPREGFATGERGERVARGEWSVPGSGPRGPHGTPPRKW